jgi:hypothetical protein
MGYRLFKHLPPRLYSHGFLATVYKLQLVVITDNISFYHYGKRQYAHHNQKEIPRAYRTGEIDQAASVQNLKDLF